MVLAPVGIALLRRFRPPPSLGLSGWSGAPPPPPLPVVQRLALALGSAPGGESTRAGRHAAAPLQVASSTGSNVRRLTISAIAAGADDSLPVMPQYFTKGADGVLEAHGRIRRSFTSAAWRRDVEPVEESKNSGVGSGDGGEGNGSVGDDGVDGYGGGGAGGGGAGGGGGNFSLGGKPSRKELMVRGGSTNLDDDSSNGLSDDMGLSGFAAAGIGGIGTTLGTVGGTVGGFMSSASTMANVGVGSAFSGFPSFFGYSAASGTAMPRRQPLTEGIEL
jgi:hypothetical protein